MKILFSILFFLLAISTSLLPSADPYINPDGWETGAERERILAEMNAAAANAALENSALNLTDGPAVTAAEIAARAAALNVFPGIVDNPVAIDLLGKNDPFIPSMVSANNTISTLESFVSTVDGKPVSGTSSSSSTKSESAAAGFEDCILKAWGPGPYIDMSWNSALNAFSNLKFFILFFYSSAPIKKYHHMNIYIYATILCSAIHCTLQGAVTSGFPRLQCIYRLYNDEINGKAQHVIEKTISEFIAENPDVHDFIF